MCIVFILALTIRRSRWRYNSGECLHWGAQAYYLTQCLTFYTHTLMQTRYGQTWLETFLSRHNTIWHNTGLSKPTDLRNLHTGSVECQALEWSVWILSVLLAAHSSLNKPYLQIKLNANKPRLDFKHFLSLQPFIAFLSRCLLLCRFLLSHVWQ